MPAVATGRWICESCGLIYDPEEGDLDGGIPPGTVFADIPDSWVCPVCGARKRDFVPMED
jgi:rubredoxin